MKKWNMVIDVAECTNCNLCTLATMDEYIGNDWRPVAAPMPKHGHSWIKILQKERGSVPFIDMAYVPSMCNHCEKCPVVEKAENGAVTQRPDGIVLIDPDKAKGQKHLVDACPYGHIWWNEAEQTPQAWPFDAHLLDQGWVQTRGAQACPTAAMKTHCLEDADMQKMVADEGLEVLNPEYGTKPRVYYKNLWRYTTAFIGGSVSAEANGVVDCVEGAKVALLKDGKRQAQAVTDIYGDFKFDKLPEDGGAYTVEIEAEGHAKKTVAATLGESVYLGEIRL
jgi:Fe-S-cluster-containing dehydrogenase component